MELPTQSPFTPSSPVKSLHTSPRISSSHSFSAYNLSPTLVPSSRFHPSSQLQSTRKAIFRHSPRHAQIRYTPSAFPLSSLPPTLDILCDCLRSLVSPSILSHAHPRLYTAISRLSRTTTSLIHVLTSLVTTFSRTVSRIKADHALAMNLLTDGRPHLAHTHLLGVRKPFEAIAASTGKLAMAFEIAAAEAKATVIALGHENSAARESARDKSKTRTNGMHLRTAHVRSDTLGRSDVRVVEQKGVDRSHGREGSGSRSSSNSGAIRTTDPRAHAIIRGNTVMLSGSSVPVIAVRSASFSTARPIGQQSVEERMPSLRTSLADLVVDNEELDRESGKRTKGCEDPLEEEDVEVERSCGYELRHKYDDADEGMEEKSSVDLQSQSVDSLFRSSIGELQQHQQHQTEKGQHVCSPESASGIDNCATQLRRIGAMLHVMEKFWRTIADGEKGDSNGGVSISELVARVTEKVGMKEREAMVNSYKFQAHWRRMIAVWVAVGGVCDDVVAAVAEVRREYYRLLCTADEDDEYTESDDEFSGEHGDSDCVVDDFLNSIAHGHLKGNRLGSAFSEVSEESDGRGRGHNVLTTKTSLKDVVNAGGKALAVNSIGLR